LKRTFVIVFCFVYFFSSVGVAFNLHYCGGKLKSISLIHSDEKDCCGTKMKKKDCCKEKSFSYKIKDNQNSNGKYFSLKNTAKIIDIYINSVCNTLEKTNLGLIITPDFHAPPDIGFSDTYLVNNVFRI